MQNEIKKDIQKAAEVFPMAVTPYYASLIRKDDPACPIRAQCLPDPRELISGCGDMEDPLHEEGDSPVPGLTHRYPDRVLLLVTNECAVYCRHCTRKRKVGDNNRGVTDHDLERGVQYIKAHPEIRDVLLSGGDPFILQQPLEGIIRKIRISPRPGVRIGTGHRFMPSASPKTGPVLKKYHPFGLTRILTPRE